MKKYSDRLLALLFLAKHSYTLTDRDDDLKKMIAESLKDIFHPKMDDSDIYSHVLEAVLEAREEPKFQISPNSLSSFIKQLSFGIIRQSYFRRSISSLEQQYTNTDLFNYQLRVLMDMLMLSNISWCKEYEQYVFNKIKEI
jgi:hypothetical protein